MQTVIDPLWTGMKQNGVLGKRKVHFFAEIGSTNDVAMALGRGGEEAGTLVVAESQNSGRGRLGREWLSPHGQGLYFSILLRPCLEPADLAKITLAAALAVCKAVEAVSGLKPGIKWPNDLLLAGKKFCGILTETGPIRAGEPPLVVLGIGLNVSTPASAFPESLRGSATSLYAHSGVVIARGELLAAIVTAVDGEVASLAGGAFAEIMAEWRTRDALLGRRLAWLTPSGKVVEGVALGPDAAGVLHIRDDSGREHEVVSGDLAMAGRGAGLV